MQTTTTILCLSALAATAASAATLSLDLQPTDGTTAAGFLALEHTNGTAFDAAGTDYTEFGATITVTLSAAGVETSPDDFRAVTRDTGTLTDVRNDWIGVDARGSAGDASFTIIVSGLPAGGYTWESLLHDGGPGISASNEGNIFGDIATSFVDATGTTAGTNTISAENPGGGGGGPQATSSFTTSFMSDGTNPVSFTVSSSGTGDDAIFAFVDSVVIEDVPEPSSALLGLVGALGLLRRRR